MNIVFRVVIQIRTDIWGENRERRRGRGRGRERDRELGMSAVDAAAQV